MAAWGLMMFVASPFATVLGVVDPNLKRGTALTVASLVAAPLGLILSAL
ncbi:hypothetical protein [Salinarimonas soli]|nr:hypothetical protein [Salinarimonas soli]